MKRRLFLRKALRAVGIFSRALRRAKSPPDLRRYIRISMM